MGELALQCVLGTDRKNPMLTLFRRQGENTIEIYYGGHPFETVTDDSRHISFRTAVGRLYNAGLCREKLCRLFGVSIKTMRRWAQALLHEDPEKSLHILSGIGNRKLIPVKKEENTETNTINTEETSKSQNTIQQNESESIFSRIAESFSGITGMSTSANASTTSLNVYIVIVTILLGFIIIGIKKNRHGAVSSRSPHHTIRHFDSIKKHFKTTK